MDSSWHFAATFAKINKVIKNHFVSRHEFCFNLEIWSKRTMIHSLDHWPFSAFTHVLQALIFPTIWYNLICNSLKLANIINFHMQYILSQHCDLIFFNILTVARLIAEKCVETTMQIRIAASCQMPWCQYIGEQAFNHVHRVSFSQFLFFFIGLLFQRHLELRLILFLKFPTLLLCIPWIRLLAWPLFSRPTVSWAIRLASQKLGHSKTLWDYLKL